MTKHKIGVVVIEGHIQGLANTRMLGKAGIPVIVIDKDNCIARYSKYCWKYFHCPDYNSPEFIDFLIRLSQAENLQNWLLLPSNDHAVYNISQHKQRLSQYYTIITEDFEVIDKIYNKRELLNLAQRISIPIPESYLPQAENPQQVNLRYPVIIKGNNGLSFYKDFHQKAIFIKNPAELKSIWSGPLSRAKPADYFIQEVIPLSNKAISVTVFAVKGEVHTYWMGIKVREHPLHFGTATCCQSMFDSELIELSRSLIHELNYTGVCEIEWLKDSRDNQYKLIEINARTWLWVGLAAKCGINYPGIIYDYCFFQTIPVFNSYKTGVVWLNLFTDSFYSVIRIIKRIDNLKVILTYYSKFTEASWDKHDPLPFLMYSLSLIKFLRKR